MLDLTYAPSADPAVKCVNCPREGEARWHTVRNYGLGSDWLFESILLCEMCVLLIDDVL